MKGDNMEKTSEENWVEEIGSSAYASIVNMVCALECDFDRMKALQNLGHDRDAVESTELVVLEEEADGCENEEEARNMIHEDPLEIMVRSDWEPTCETLTPTEFCILLTTGGPAVRIRGELNEYREPCRAWLEVQDWFKPWTQFFPASQDTLLTYASCFYYGEG